MAQRRMIALKIVDSQLFLDMPMTAQLLYLHMAFRADDDGFVGNPRVIQRMIGASDDDMRILIAKAFVIPFDGGLCVIRHWRIHNYIQSDRYNPTMYASEKRELTTDETGAYIPPEVMDTKCIQNVSSSGYKVDTQVRLGKVSLGKVSQEIGEDMGTGGADAPQPTPKPSKSKPKFEVPTVEEVAAYCKERGNNIDPEHFWAWYDARGWKTNQGKPVERWQSCVITWEKREKERGDYNGRAAAGGRNPGKSADQRDIPKEWHIPGQIEL